jgi:hypothetical protein
MFAGALPCSIGMPGKARHRQAREDGHMFMACRLRFLCPSPILTHHAPFTLVCNRPPPPPPPGRPRHGRSSHPYMYTCTHPHTRQTSSLPRAHMRPRRGRGEGGRGRHGGPVPVTSSLKVPSTYGLSTPYSPCSDLAITYCTAAGFLTAPKGAKLSTLGHKPTRCARESRACVQRPVGGSRWKHTHTYTRT